MASIYSEVLHRHGITATVKRLERDIPRVFQELSCRVDPRRDRFSSAPGGARGFWHHFLQRLCQHLDAEAPTRFASAELFERFAGADAWRVYPDVVPMLCRLSAAGLRLGLISNWDERLPRVLRALELDRFFDAVEYSSHRGVEKPDPRIFHGCLEALEVDAADALHVGDGALEDVEGALSVGMRALRIDRRDPACDLGALLEPLLQLDGGPGGGGRHARG